MAADAASVRDAPATLGNLFSPPCVAGATNLPADLAGSRAGPGERS